MNADHDSVTDHPNEVERLVALQREATTVTAELDAVRAEEAELGAQLAEAEQAARRAREERDRLGGVSAVRLWSVVRGTHDDDVDRQGGVVDRTEAELTRLRVALEDVQVRRSMLHGQADELGQVDQQLADAMDDVERNLIRRRHPVARSLAGLAERRAEVAERFDDVDGDHAVLSDVATELESVIDDLDWHADQERSAVMDAALRSMNGRRSHDEAVAAFRVLVDEARGLARSHGLAIGLEPLPRMLTLHAADPIGNGYPEVRADWVRHAERQLPPIAAAVQVLGEQKSVVEAELDELDQLRLRWVRNAAADLAGGESGGLDPGHSRP
ncbi:hypothetical protein ACQBAR_16670 [Propionibacteriaceae bacterium Y1685]